MLISHDFLFSTLFYQIFMKSYVQVYPNSDNFEHDALSKTSRRYQQTLLTTPATKVHGPFHLYAEPESESPDANRHPITWSRHIPDNRFPNGPVLSTSANRCHVSGTRCGDTCRIPVRDGVRVQAARIPDPAPVFPS